MNTAQDTAFSRKGEWLQTFTGRQFYPADPQPGDFDPVDIAHGLANICRFGGQCNKRYCPTPDQRVLTADLRWVPAGDIRIGTELLGFDEHPTEPGSTGCLRRRYRHSIVTAVVPVKATVYRLVMADGSSTTTSAEHPWLVATKSSRNQAWRRASQLVKDLGEGRKRYMHKFIEPWKSAVSWEDGWLAGIYDGEGSLSFTDRRGVQFSIAQNDGLVLNKIAQLLTAHGFDANVGSSGSYATASLQLRDGWREMARLLGSIRPVRLLDKFVAGLRSGLLDKQMDGQGEPSEIVRAYYEGEQWVPGIETSTHTYFCEGYAAHNSVAEHCYHMSQQVDPEDALLAMLHDAAEAYIGDIVRPVKLMLPDFGRMERSIQYAIYDQFGFSYSVAFERQLQAIHDADDRMLATEARQLMPNAPASWKPLPDPYPDMYLYGWAPEIAEMYYRQRLQELGVTL